MDPVSQWKDQLENAMPVESGYVAGNLMRHAVEHADWQLAESLLTYPREFVRHGALRQLHELSGKRSYSIDPLIPLLERIIPPTFTDFSDCSTMLTEGIVHVLALHALYRADCALTQKLLVDHARFQVRNNMAFFISQALEREGNNIDPSSILPFLSKALEDVHSGVRRNAAVAVTHHYLHTGNLASAGLLLESGNEAVCRGVGTALHKNHSNTVSFLPLLLKALEHSDLEVRKSAGRRLYLKPEEWIETDAAPPIAIALARACIRDAAEPNHPLGMAFRVFLDSCKSPELLNRMEQGIGDAARSQLQKPVPAQERATRQIPVLRVAVPLLHKIDERKAHLTQAYDGMLLTGETIPTPIRRNPFKIYQLARR